MRSPLARFTAALALLLTGAALPQDKTRPAGPDWPQYRGPNSDGVSRETGWMTAFPASGPKKLWEAKLGAGYSNVAIRKGRIYTLSSDPANMQMETVWCLDVGTGKTLWKHPYEVESVERGRNPVGGTPALTEDRVFAYGAGMNLQCLDSATGKVVWSRDLMKELPGQAPSYGYQISPVLHEGLVIVAALQGQKAGGKPHEAAGGPYPGTGGVLLAFDQKTGKEVWHLNEGASAWSSPVIATIEGKPTLVHLTGRVALGVDPSSGKLKWRFDPKDAGLSGQDMAASPVIAGDLVVAPIHMAYGSPEAGTASTVCFRIRNGQPELVWKRTDWCHWFQSCAVWDGLLLGYDEKSTFRCTDLKTGAEKWKSKEMGVTGKTGGGFMVAGGKVLAIDLRRNLIVAEVSPTGCKVVSSAPVVPAGSSGYQCQTAPVLLDGRLYVRNHTDLICFDVGAGMR
jgi:outer membrane protein assembly factor BamB